MVTVVDSCRQFEDYREVTHSTMNRNEDNKGMEMKTTKVVFETMGACQQSLLFFGQKRLGNFFQSFFILISLVHNWNTFGAKTRHMQI